MEAVEAEIEAVRQKPSRDVLFDGKKKSQHAGDAFYYEFESQNTSLRFAEVIRAEMDELDREMEVLPVEYEEDTVVLDFPKNLGEHIAKVQLEWENDFVLRRLLGELDKLADNPESTERIERLFLPSRIEMPDISDEDIRILDDTRRNEAQQDALMKSLKSPVLFVWGPPGTGKTSTVGYMMANYLVKDLRVLFVSNTNRAVDVGMLSLLDALDMVERDMMKDQVTRFGEIALENDHLEQIHFDRQLQLKKDRQRDKAARLINRLSEFNQLQSEVDHLLETGQEVPEELTRKFNLVQLRMEDEGGADAVEAKIDRMLHVNERRELQRKKLVGTTLAKVCTSELFEGLGFDAVIIDEGSMANLPYLMVMAARAEQHMVVVGDPMQLPPISITDKPLAREFLEEDIFTFVSNAKSAEDLFDWHDRNPVITAFFDTQYRMKEDLAETLSSVFYEGRLQTEHTGAALNGDRSSAEDDRNTVTVIDTSRYNPVLHQKEGGKGFSPINEVHQNVVVEICRKLVLRNQVLPGEIGVMVPFRQSVYDLRRRLRDEGYEQIEVGTIHTFQGREKKAIIFDTVMSGEQQGGRRRHYTVRPFDEDKNGLSVARLLNVAFSRSREQLLIVADMRHIRKMYEGKYLGRLLSRFKGS